MTNNSEVNFPWPDEQVPNEDSYRNNRKKWNESLTNKKEKQNDKCK